MNEHEERTALKRKQNIILENRKTLNVSGVNDVAGFSEEKVVLNTELGILTIIGSDLSINSFSQESGELSLQGMVDSLHYAEMHKEEGSFFSRLFR